MKFAGRADEVDDLSQLPQARIAATLDLGEHLRADVKVPSLRPPQGRVDAEGGIDVSALRASRPTASRRCSPAAAAAAVASTSRSARRTRAAASRSNTSTSAPQTCGSSPRERPRTWWAHGHARPRAHVAGLLPLTPPDPGAPARV